MPTPTWLAREMVSGHWHIANEATGATVAQVRDEPTARLIAQAPKLLDLAQYFDWAADVIDTRDASPEEEVEVIVTVQALRDLAAVLNDLAQAEGSD